MQDSRPASCTVPSINSGIDTGVSLFSVKANRDTPGTRGGTKFPIDQIAMTPHSLTEIDRGGPLWETRWGFNQVNTIDSAASVVTSTRTLVRRRDADTISTQLGIISATTADSVQ